MRDALDMYYAADTYQQQLASRILTLRKEYGWSQSDMVSRHGYKMDDWRGLEAGAGLSVASLLKVCDIFGVTMPELVDGLGN